MRLGIFGEGTRPMKLTSSAASSQGLELPRLKTGWQVAAIAIALILVAGGGFFAGFVTAGGAAAGAPQQANPPGFEVFWEAWNYIEQEFYYDIPSVEERTYGAIRGMLASLGDDYTAFIQPSIAQIERQNVEGSFGGIGAYVRLNEFGQLYIVYAFPDHPAQAAGLRDGDIVLSVDGRSLENLTLAEGTALIRGPIGTVVHLEIYRPSTDESFEVDVERRQIEVPTVYGQMLDGNVAYVSLFQFNGIATSELEEQITALLAENPRALIFDLRGNPGGLLDEAISVSDLFLPEGLVATQRTSLAAEERPFYADSGDVAETVPLIVLIDGGSASASEIVAGAISDRQRGVLIGTPTFGKGSIQLLHDLSDGSQLRITYGAWYTPNEDPLEGVGLQPDILVELPDDLTTLQPGDDPWLDAAMAYIDEHYPGAE